MVKGKNKIRNSPEPGWSPPSPVQQIENVVVEVCLRVIDRRCVGPSWLVTVGGSRRGYAIGYAGVGALAAETLDAIVILW